MAKMITTEAIESKTRVWAGLDIFDFFFIFAYTSVSFALKSQVHDSLQIPFMIFSGLMAVFLTIKSGFNKKRRNYESIFFLLTRDTAIYKPFLTGTEKGIKENE